MAELQAKFDKFHRTIKLKNKDDILEDKRRTVLEALTEGLKKNFEAQDKTPPDYEHFDQGSYGLRTGIKPLKDNDYDIDIAIVYNISKNDEDPLTPKEWTYEALKDHTDKVEIRRSCVTVFYKAGYHVDLAIYADKDMRTDGELPLAKGKKHSSKENKFWEPNEPQAIHKLFKDTFNKKTHEDQFRRCLRYLKRWRDHKYQNESGNGAPVGIGLTLYGLKKNKFKYIESATDTPKDIDALLHLVKNMLKDFEKVKHDGEDAERLIVKPPYKPGQDVFSRMTNTQMGKFKERLEKLRDALVEAGDDDTSEKTACDLLRGQFGKDFPEGGDPKDTSESRKSSSRPVIKSGDQGA